MSRCVPAAALLALAVASPSAAQAPTPAPLTIRGQVDGVNSRRVVTVAAFCRGPQPCAGTAKLTRAGRTLGKAPFSAAARSTFKTPVRASASVVKALHTAPRKRMKALLTMTLADGTAATHTITMHL